MTRICDLTISGPFLFKFVGHDGGGNEDTCYALPIRMLEKFYWKRLLQPEIDEEAHGKQRSREQGPSGAEELTTFLPSHLCSETTRL